MTARDAMYVRARKPFDFIKVKFECKSLDMPKFMKSTFTLKTLSRKIRACEDAQNMLKSLDNARRECKSSNTSGPMSIVRYVPPDPCDEPVDHHDELSRSDKNSENNWREELVIQTIFRVSRIIHLHVFGLTIIWDYLGSDVAGPPQPETTKEGIPKQCFQPHT